MYVKAKPKTSYRWAKTVDGILVKLECKGDDCGTDSLIWGFIVILLAGLFVVGAMCFGVPV